MSKLISAHYGKAAIPVMKVERGGACHTLFQAVISVDTEGERIVDAYTQADNSSIVATDTMKNFIYAATLQYPVTSLEDLARHLGCELLRRYSTMSRVTTTVEEIAWEPLRQAEDPGGPINPISFQRRDAEQDYARAAVTRAGAELEHGLRNLTVLKTTDSAFSGYVQDQFTTLPETEDRILATSLSGSWRLRDAELDYRRLGQRVKQIIVEVFIRLRSRSVQELAFEMGRAVLQQCSDVLEITLNLPNLHCNLLDLSRFGLHNEDTLYVPTEAPHGDLYVTVGR